MTDPLDHDFASKLEITIPEETHTAGRPNVTRVVIHNPHDFPVEIIDIQAPQSSEIRRLLEPRSGLPDGLTAAPKEGFARRLSRAVGSLALTEVSFGGIRAEFPRNQRQLNIKAETNSNVVIDRNLDEFDAINIAAEEGATIEFKDKIDSAGQESADSIHIVPPRCDKVAYFSISTRGWLFFTPQRVSLSTEVRYRAQGHEKSQVVSSYFDIKPPLSSMIIGSIVGGGLGAAARMLQSRINNSIEDMAVQGGAAIIMSLIAAIALSRKTGTQGFITVEDFFGAFVVGALIGYGGSEYFDRAILPAADDGS